MKNILDTTISLKESLDLLKDKFEVADPPKSHNDRAYFLEMKEDTEPIYFDLQEWQTLALEASQKREIPIYPNQIIATVENYELIIVHSYYLDIRRRKFMEYYNSCMYVFHQVIHALTVEG